MNDFQSQGTASRQNNIRHSLKGTISVNREVQWELTSGRWGGIIAIKKDNHYNYYYLSYSTHDINPEFVGVRRMKS
jgi:hypothetical protein